MIKSFTMQFIILDLIFIITSLVLKFMEITEIKMKITRKWTCLPQKQT
jgi:hypothetical protein